MKNIIILFVSLFVGMSLQAKLTQTSTSLTEDYTVHSGDTLYLIAKKYHIKVRDILEANQMGARDVIRAGQVLKIPYNADAQDATSLTTKANVPKMAALDNKQSDTVKGASDYTVQNGDTLFTIARAHHTSIKAVLKANAMDRNAVIKVGQRLSVPNNTYFPESKTSTKNTETVSSSKNTSSKKGSYVVREGDSLFSIARKNHIVISKLMRLNGLGLTDSLRVGQVLNISTQGTFVATATIPTKPSHTNATAPKKELPVGAMPSYTVKKGDTLWSIARKHHLTLAEIRKLNKMKKNDHIRTGTILAVGKAIRPKAKTYKVRKGDTLWLIAKKNHMSTKTLRRLNGMHRKDGVHAGMVLALVKGAKVPTAKNNKVRMVAQLKKMGASKRDIASVLARVKKSKKKHPNLKTIFAQIKKEKKRKTIKTPLRITKTSKHKKSRMSSALAILSGRGGSSRSSRSANRTIRIAKRYLGRRYVWGAVGPRSFDCSGFTQYVMRKSKGVRLPRVSRKQAYYGRYISRSHLRPGDLIFFDTSHRRRGYVNHVGIYIGNNKFIHASSARHRVVITSLNRPFYSARFKWGRRVN